MAAWSSPPPSEAPPRVASNSTAELVELSRRTAQAEGVASRATFERADIFKSDFSDATVVTLFLLPSVNLRLRPTLLGDAARHAHRLELVRYGGLAAGRVRAERRGLPGAVRRLPVAGAGEGGGNMGDGEQAAGAVADVPEAGRRDARGRAVDADMGRPLRGTEIVFTIDDERYVGHVDGREMRGTIEGGEPWRATFLKP